MFDNNVYLIRSGNSDRYKIGYSADPMFRMKTLQTSNPELLHLIFCCRGDTKIEKIFLNRYHHKRLLGEWFIFSEAEITILIDEMKVFNFIVYDEDGTHQLDFNQEDINPSLDEAQELFKLKTVIKYANIINDNIKYVFTTTVDIPYYIMIINNAGHLLKTQISHYQSISGQTSDCPDIKQSDDLSQWLIDFNKDKWVTKLPSKITNRLKETNKYPGGPNEVNPSARKLSLNIVNPDKNQWNRILESSTVDDIKTENYPNISFPTRNIIILNKDSSQELYEKFKEFMHNPNIIRYGLYDRIGAKRLTQLFNESMHENVSFNHTFPKLMRRFIEEHPQYGITKKTMTEGVTYLRIGFVGDQAPKEHHPPLTVKEKNDKVRFQKRVILQNMKDMICQVTGWTSLQYQQMIDLRLITVIMFGKVINIEATIQVAKGHLVEYLHNKISKLNRVVRSAEDIRDDFLRATFEIKPNSIHSDIKDTTEVDINTGTRCEARLRATNGTCNAVSTLEIALAKYTETVPGLPILNYIIYPDIQYMHNLAIWLKNNRIDFDPSFSC
ncbi:GIY-YIG family nuclease [uncultured virus]|nr:GIY-YIG family nuclease [uncultured virus]